MSLLSTSYTLDSSSQAATALSNYFAMMLNRAVRDLREISLTLWKDPASEAQACFDKFGADAGALVASKDALVAFITALAEANGQTITDYIAEEDYIPPDMTFTVELDGTVTVTET